MVKTDLQYFGTIGFIQSLMRWEKVSFDQDHSFSKMSFKNRTIIATAQGPLHLSIPILGGRAQKAPLKDIRIAYDSPWHEQHYKAIVSSYQRSPYFEYYQESLEQLYQTKPQFLQAFLIATHDWAKKHIKGDWEIIASEAASQKFFDPWLPKNYSSYPNQIKYQQVFEDKTGFLPNLSILDLLFNCGGKQAKQLLMSK
jgi:hypothetical protein